MAWPGPGRCLMPVRSRAAELASSTDLGAQCDLHSIGQPLHASQNCSAGLSAKLHLLGSIGAGLLADQRLQGPCRVHSAMTGLEDVMSLLMRPVRRSLGRPMPGQDARSHASLHQVAREHIASDKCMWLTPACCLAVLLRPRTTPCMPVDPSDRP